MNDTTAPTVTPSTSAPRPRWPRPAARQKLLAFASLLALLLFFGLASPNFLQADNLMSIAEELNLHSLAVADAVSSHQRAKLDRYPDYLFLNAYDVSLDTVTGELATSELSAFIAKSALVTVRDDAGFDVNGQVGESGHPPAI